MTAQQELWVARQRAGGWSSYERAVYALARLGVQWERCDDPPDDLERYMRAWWTSSRRCGSRLAPDRDGDKTAADGREEV